MVFKYKRIFMINCLFCCREKLAEILVEIPVEIEEKLRPPSSGRGALGIVGAEPPSVNWFF